jgi:hypothetical protein
MENENVNKEIVSIKSNEVVKDSKSGERKLRINLPVVGDVNIKVLKDEDWFMDEIEDFVCKSETSFNSILSTRQTLHKPKLFEDSLQCFIERMQEVAEKKTSGQLRKHFVDWLNSLNGKLEDTVRSKKAANISHQNKLKVDAKTMAQKYQ